MGVEWVSVPISADQRMLAPDRGSKESTRFVSVEIMLRVQAWPHWGWSPPWAPERNMMRSDRATRGFIETVDTPRSIRSRMTRSLAWTGMETLDFTSVDRTDFLYRR